MEADVRRPSIRWIAPTLAMLASLAIASPVSAFWLGSNDALAAAVFHGGGQQGIVLAQGLGQDRARVSIAFPSGGEAGRRRRSPP